MKLVNGLYWATTSLLALVMAFSAYAYLTQPAMIQTFGHLGYPAHFRIQLAIAKLLGVILLLAPVGPRIKEWTYAGFAFTFVAAFLSHSAIGDPIAERIAPLIALAVLAVSYVSYHRRHAALTLTV